MRNSCPSESCGKSTKQLIGCANRSCLCNWVSFVFKLSENRPFMTVEYIFSWEHRHSLCCVVRCRYYKRLWICLFHIIWCFKTEVPNPGLGGTPTWIVFIFIALSGNTASPELKLTIIYIYILFFFFHGQVIPNKVPHLARQMQIQKKKNICQKHYWCYQKQ